MGEEAFRDQLIRRLEETGMKVPELARRSGVNKDAIYKIIQRPGSSTSAEKARAIAQVLDFTPRGEAADTTSLPVVGAEDQTDDEIVMVPVYDVSASAGVGVMPPDYVPIVRKIAFALRYLKYVLGIEPGHASLITIVGDSMLPTLKEGDFVLMDMGVDTFATEGIYVFRHDGAVHVKRVMRSSKPGHILAIPDNPRYREMEYAASDVALLGRVKWGGGLL